MMKKYFWTLFLLYIIQNLSFDIQATSLNRDSLEKALNIVIENRPYYTEQKRQTIKLLEEMQKNTDLAPRSEYEINKKIYNEYVKYKADTALYYLEINKEISSLIKDDTLINENAIQRAYIYSTKGLFVEATKILEAINAKALPKDLQILYYRVCGYYNDHYGQSNNEYAYYKKSDLYRDSLLLAIEDTFSLDYKIVKAQDLLYKHNPNAAKNILLNLLESTTDSNPQRAEIAYWLGAIAKDEGDKEMQKKYFMVSAITDITNVIKDNASLHSLALVYYAEGNIDKAYQFMSLAMEDAVECNVRYRASEAMESYPIINASYLEKEHYQQQKLRGYLISISILAFLLIGGTIYIYVQMKRVSRIRKELYRSSVKLIELNQDITETNKQLQAVNVQLSEANHVKEEYIAIFFDICSEYIHKLDEFRKTLNRLAANKAMDELYQKLKSTSIIESELKELYIRFDTIFLSLFPTFVEEFNALLIKEEQIKLKPNELLNTELRIFALIRLGITDSVKIASFLRYSLSTIYNYRTKARNKAAVSRGEFEEEVMKIGIILKKQ